LLFIRGVALPASTEVLQRGLNCGALFTGKSSALCAINYNTENVEKALDSSMAILEHANRIVETAVRLCANLNRHNISSLLPFLVIVVQSPTIGSQAP
jgi:hypothetical protein